MKKILYLSLILCTLSLLTGCETAPPQAPEEEIQHMEVEGTQKEAVGVGSSCVTDPCHAGLECDINFVCVDHVIDHDIVCPETHKPVCAYRDGRKNGYLNECQAKRHGAEILSEGFCESDESVVGNCEAAFLSIGNCSDTFEGYAFKDGECVKYEVGGCDAEIPFDTLESCQAACK